MAKRERDKSDGLEIISVGSLYNGPLDKKYWSSSRGKDRYPYPVGYHAMRTHNGITYTMHIHEGLKGPSFTIASTDGQSWSGQTPDIAWKSCQKTSASLMKLGNGKRYSCKIDGVEFFGFKNQFVLRLFRELVANVNRKAVSSSSCVGYLEKKHQTCSTEPCRQPDLVQYLEKSQVTGKRSRKSGVSAVKSVSSGTLIKSQLENRTHSTDVPALELRSEKKYIQNQKSSTCSPSSNDSHGVCTKSGSVDASITSKTVDEVKDCLHSAYSSEQFNKEFCNKDESVFISSHNSASMRGTMLNEEEPFNRNKVISTPLLNSSEKVEKGETSSRNASQTINGLELTAPDSLDIELDGTLNSNGVNELTAACLITSVDSKTESRLGEDAVTSTEHISSEKSGIDLVGQEITTSMMMVLLPRALPLLKKDTRQKKTTMNPSGISVYKKRSTYKSSNTSISADVTSSVALITEDAGGDKQREKAHMLSTDPGPMEPPSGDIGPTVLDSYDNNHSEMNVDSQCLLKPPSGDVAPMVPDSYESNQTERDVDDQLLMVSSAVQEDLITSGRDNSTPKITKLPGSVDVLQDSTVSGDTLHLLHTEHQTLRQRLQFHSKKKLSKVSAIPYEEKAVKTFPSSIEETICTTDVKLIPRESLVKEINAEKARDHNVEESFSQIPDVGDLAAQRDIPLSESIICRSFKDTCATGSIDTSDNFQQNMSYNLSNQDSKYKEKFDGQRSNNHQERNIMVAEAPSSHISSVTSPTLSQSFYEPAICKQNSQNCGNKEPPRNQALPEQDVPAPLFLDQGESFGSKLISSNIEETGSHLTAQTNIKHDSDPVNIFELMGCYVHPGPVLSVLLSTNNGAICMCVLCGSFVDEQQTLYMHKTLTQGQSKGCPSLIGHASIVFPVTNDALSREIALNGSILQFTPDGQYLVLLDCIKAPYCRKEKISCPCPECTSLSSKQNAVKIVQVKRGYLSVVATMKTTDTIHCILVCEPNYLIAAEGSKRLHIWVMNSSWSEDITESYLPTSDCMDPYVMELKRIPKCPNLVLGHNGFGIFCLWDIAKCILVSRFSAPSISLCRFSPVSLLTLRRQGTVACLDEEHSNIIDASTNLFLENANSHTCSVVGKDVLIPLLISNTDLPSLQSSDRQMNTLGWRQALLVNNEVLSDDILDSRAVAVGTLAGHGIIGTCDGHVDIWELSTGAILGNLHQFKGSAVSCIATDDLSSGAFAVAADCWLRVYSHS
ncbi:hypothetical protein POM88_018019 [Heracleum sosnowskyi]|uniref:Uncharacterized protein n=1 Tax=Heracleum sosnowskyi TaxID=360622 RepID=A0AAD8IQJ9_9APIA|nr:hypothetical protein POM88_018019 [Heracleum sosnowskyi]